MREKCIVISERALMFSIGGQLFSQAPNREPRKVAVIMNKVRDHFRGVAHNNNEYYTLQVPETKLISFMEDMLMSIDEFKELNLSQNEYDKNVGVDDEDRPKYSFTSAHDKYTSESWRSDFIDLVAFTGNAIRAIYMLHDYDLDCFCCSNEGTEKCSKCVVNPDLTVNYESSRKPKGKYTFACKYDCYRSRYICCEECDDVENCDKKCNGNSKECNLKL